MKDQKHQGQDHEHDKSSHKSESHSPKDGDKHEAQKGTTYQAGHGKETAGREGSEHQDRQGKMKSAQGAQFSDLDHDKIAKFHDELEKDEALKGRFQADPQGVLQEHGIAIPEGYTASYDNQYVKPSDGSKVGMYGYRVGNINFSK